MISMHPAFTRTMALALLAALVLALYALVAQPIIDARHDYDESIIRSLDLIARYERIGEDRPALEAKLAALDKSASASTSYLEGASASLAGATLQNRARLAIDNAGGTIRSSQILPVLQQDELERIAIRINFTSDLAGLQQALHALESASPYLFLENVTIQSQGRVNRRRARLNEDQSLAIRLDVFGFFVPGAS